MLPTCAGCKRPIFGSHFTALGQSWHPEHFVCGGCQLPISERSFLSHAQTPYHERCFKARFLPKCLMCSNPMDGPYYRDYWGNVYCERHATEHPHCEYCHRLVSLKLTGGGLQYPDNRISLSPEWDS
jgi:hypothetical protein